MPDVRLIDGNAIVEKLKSYYETLSPDVQSELIRRDEVSSCIAELINAPTIGAQPVKHGKWERTDMFVKCSECGVELLDDAFFGIHVFDDGYMPFCPNCGRRMTY